MFNFAALFTFICGFVLSINQVLANTDPTRPFGHSASASVLPEGKKLVLESIIHGDGVHTVVINGQILKPYDHIGEYQLTAVNDQSVVLRSKTQRLKLHVFKPNILKIKAY